MTGPAAPGLFDGRPRPLLTVLALIFAIAAGVRLYRLDAPGMLPDRDYTSAVFARDYFFRTADSIEAWRRQVAAVTHQNQPILEPPITEWLASGLYRIAGSEDMRLARLLTSCFWVVGGMFVFRIARSLVSTDAAVFATAYYLLAPLSILLSRSFQADSLMMLLFLISLFGVVRYYERPSWRVLLIVTAISGLTLLYRPLVIFGLLGAFIVAAIQRNGLKALVDRGVVAFVGLSCLPTVIYYGYGTFVAKHFGWKLATSFQPNLLVHAEFWNGWRQLALLAIGYTFLAASLLGAAMLRRGLPRAIVAGLAAGYCAFGLLFTMHIHTHGYYHAQLIPIVAIAASPLVIAVVERLRQTTRYWPVPVVAVLSLAVCADVQEVRGQLQKPALYESPAVAREIGDIVGHSTRVAFLSRNYGMPLQYHGELAGAYWPRSLTYYLHPAEGDRALTVQERLAALPFVPDYFVITAMEEFRRNHADLQNFLDSRCVRVAQTSEYLIYKECTASPSLTALGNDPGGSTSPVHTGSR